MMCASAAAQCPNEWIKTDGFPGVGVEPEVYAVTTWDSDGAGPQSPRLVIGGFFQYIADRVVDSVGVLNPETGQWEDIGGVGIQSPQKKGLSDGLIYALQAFENDLVVAGEFDLAGGVTVNNLARWDGKSWSPFGEDLAGFVTSMTVYNGELIAAGSFLTTSSGTMVNRIARWNGASWLPLGSPAGMNGPVNNVIVHNGELIAVGSFTSAGGVPANRIARWNGAQWAPLGIGLNSGGFALTVLDDDLYVGGNFTLAGGVPDTRGVARWDGAGWHPVGGGALFGVGDLMAFNGDIVASGVFTVTLNGQPVTGLARFDTASQTWGVMGGGFCCGQGAFGFAVHNDGGGDELVIVGSFRKIGDRVASGIARWSDATASWDRIAPGFNWTPYRFTTYRGELIAGGFFESAGDSDARGVARWDGTAWYELDGGSITSVSHIVNALEVFDDELIIAGNFNSVGGVPAENIAAYNADTRTWQALGSGITPGGTEIAIVNALAVYNGELIAGGQFGEAGGVPCAAIARWNGSQWQPLGTGLAGWAHALTVYNGELIVIGSFFSAGGNPAAQGLARWNGSNWQAFPPGGQNGNALSVYDGKLVAGVLQPYLWNGATWTTLPGYSFDPNGDGAFINAYAVFNGELIVGGEFENACGIPEADGLVRFNGTSWSSMVADGEAMASITSGMWVHNGELIANGRIEHGDGTMSNWRRWGPACPATPGDINGDGVVNVIDLLAVINTWGACVNPNDCPEDVAPPGPPTGDDVVNVLDLLFVINHWS